MPLCVRWHCTPLRRSLLSSQNGPGKMALSSNGLDGQSSGSAERLRRASASVTAAARRCKCPVEKRRQVAHAPGPQNRNPTHPLAGRRAHTWSCAGARARHAARAVGYKFIAPARQVAGREGAITTQVKLMRQRSSGLQSEVPCQQQDRCDTERPRRQSGALVADPAWARMHSLQSAISQPTPHHPFAFKMRLVNVSRAIHADTACPLSCICYDTPSPHDVDLRARAGMMWPCTQNGFSSWGARHSLRIGQQAYKYPRQPSCMTGAAWSGQKRACALPAAGASGATQLLPRLKERPSTSKLLPRSQEKAKRPEQER